MTSDPTKPLCVCGKPESRHGSPSPGLSRIDHAYQFSGNYSSPPAETGREAGTVGATPEPDELELAKSLDIFYCADLAEEGTPWEVPAEPEPEYFATLSEATVFLVNLLKKECDKFERAAPSLPSPPVGATPDSIACQNCIHLLKALECVVRIADRKTKEFDAARAAIKRTQDLLAAQSLTFPLTPHGQTILNRFRVAMLSVKPMCGGKVADPFKWTANVACKVLEEILMTPDTLRQSLPSPAPQGLRNMRRIADGLRRMRDGDRSGPSAQHMLEWAEQEIPKAASPAQPVGTPEK